MVRRVNQNEKIMRSQIEFAHEDNDGHTTILKLDRQ